MPEVLPWTKLLSKHVERAGANAYFPTNQRVRRVSTHAFRILRAVRFEVSTAARRALTRPALISGAFSRGEEKEERQPGIQANVRNPQPPAIDIILCDPVCDFAFKPIGNIVPAFDAISKPANCPFTIRCENLNIVTNNNPDNDQDMYPITIPDNNHEHDPDSDPPIGAEQYMLSERKFSAPALHAHYVKPRFGDKPRTYRQIRAERCKSLEMLNSDTAYLQVAPQFEREVHEEEVSRGMRQVSSESTLNLEECTEKHALGMITKKDTILIDPVSSDTGYITIAPISSNRDPVTSIPVSTKKNYISINLVSCKSDNIVTNPIYTKTESILTEEGIQHILDNGELTSPILNLSDVNIPIGITMEDNTYQKTIVEDNEHVYNENSMHETQIHPPGVNGFESELETNNDDLFAEGNIYNESRSTGELDSEKVVTCDVVEHSSRSGVIQPAVTCPLKLSKSQKRKRRRNRLKLARSTSTTSSCSQVSNDRPQSPLIITPSTTTDNHSRIDGELSQSSKEIQPPDEVIHERDGKTKELSAANVELNTSRNILDPIDMDENNESDTGSSDMSSSVDKQTINEMVITSDKSEGADMIYTANKRITLATAKQATNTSVPPDMEYKHIDTDIMTPVEEKHDASDNITVVEFESIATNLVLDESTTSNMVTTNKYNTCSETEDLEQISAVLKLCESLLQEDRGGLISKSQKPANTTSTSEPLNTDRTFGNSSGETTLINSEKRDFEQAQISTTRRNRTVTVNDTCTTKELHIEGVYDRVYALESPDKHCCRHTHVEEHVTQLVAMHPRESVVSIVSDDTRNRVSATPAAAPKLAARPVHLALNRGNSAPTAFDQSTSPIDRCAVRPSGGGGVVNRAGIAMGTRSLHDLLAGEQVRDATRAATGELRSPGSSIRTLPHRNRHGDSFANCRPSSTGHLLQKTAVVPTTTTTTTITTCSTPTASTAARGASLRDEWLMEDVNACNHGDNDYSSFAFGKHPSNAIASTASILSPITSTIVSPSSTCITTPLDAPLTTHQSTPLCTPLSTPQYTPLSSPLATPPLTFRSIDIPTTSCNVTASSCSSLSAATATTYATPTSSFSSPTVIRQSKSSISPSLAQPTDQALSKSKSKKGANKSVKSKKPAETSSKQKTKKAQQITAKDKAGKNSKCLLM